MLHRLIHVRRRRGAGMTEYIIIVGMIAILLVAVVKNYGAILDVTVRGNESSPGMTGSVNGINNSIVNGTGSGGASNGKPNGPTNYKNTAPGSVTPTGPSTGTAIGSDGQPHGVHKNSSGAWAWD